MKAIRKSAYGFEVKTSDGIYAAANLLNTAGAWGARISAQFGETVPIRARGPQMGVTEPLPHRILPVVGVWAHDHGGGYLRQVERGNIGFGGGAERTDVPLETGHAKADPARLPGQLRSLLPILPMLAHVSVIRTWSGCEGYVEDGLPVMGASAT
ncbi:glycine/D-amino acid oxidase-like deaminating enzyme [Neorhizobium sp. 2083]|uniref:NAD(P)/FAD-dependent oxidoreductase n=1 Tax=Neorhizobium sp. 2083 TaxID=2817762 RepID=UPI002860C147|nr:FAD-binding oxidoreductase [Neorhizobium sp. 2083]MDR6821107.1 glycine/D-amino acid oxidase-like deaminating enzyme [Neorhizobium sp. 2083]